MNVSHLENAWPGKSLASMLFVLADPNDRKRESYTTSGVAELGLCSCVAPSRLNQRAEVHPIPLAVQKTPLCGTTPEEAEPPE